MLNRKRQPADAQVTGGTAFGNFPARTLDLFDLSDGIVREEPVADGAVVLRQLATSRAAALLACIDGILGEAPLRTPVTPGGRRMSVRMSNCGALGWVSDRRGYRYVAADPASGRSWPRMPDLFATLANEAASRAGFADFMPDACLINCYEPGARMALHQDRDEKNQDAPIVSVSLGLPALFLLGGSLRADKAQQIPLGHGDVVVWGGAARLHHHGVLPLKPGVHPLTGALRFNLTLRKAG